MGYLLLSLLVLVRGTWRATLPAVAATQAATRTPATPALTQAVGPAMAVGGGDGRRCGVARSPSIRVGRAAAGGSLPGATRARPVHSSTENYTYDSCA